jgi:D-alanine-D-alanine ligase
MVRHKFHSYAVLRSVGVRVPDTWLFTDGTWIGGLSPAPGSRVIVKPIYESMGIGVAQDSVSIVDDSFRAYLEEKQLSFGQPALVQEFISGEEVGVPVARIGSVHALPPVAQRRADGTSYAGVPKTFRDEHLDGDISLARFEAPASQLLALRQAAALAFESLEMKGAGRIDFRVDADGRAWAFDTNGEPPPLANTSWAFSMGMLGLSFRDMLALWVGMCMLDHDLISGVRSE